MNDQAVIVDVREDIRAGREPFSKIMNTVATLRMGQQLLLIAPFEPVPLFHALARQGFQHSARQQESGDWEVLFTRDTENIANHGNRCEKTAAASAARSAPIAAQSVDVDARGLEPPQPLVTILEALAELPANAELRARTDRRPMHLYAQLEARGFRGETEEQADGSFVTRINRS